MAPQRRRIVSNHDKQTHYELARLQEGGASLGLGMSPGLRQVLMSILVGILVGNVTHGSGSPAKTDR